MYDSKGLFLFLPSSGGKLWRFKYRFEGKEKLISLGTYPEISLKNARDRRDIERKRVAEAIDPSANRQAAKQAKISDAENSFEVVAREWISKRSATWEPSHSSKIIRRLELDIFPWLGSRPVGEIKAPELLSALRRIEARGAVDTAHRALQNCGQIFRYAIATGRADRDVAADLRGALAPVKEGHFAAVTDPKELGALLRTLHGYEGGLVVRCALRLAPLVFLRPGELRQAEWVEFDLEKAEWVVPAKRMKIKDQGDHIVPLSKQAIAILNEIQPLTGRGRYVFPSGRSSQRPMSENAVLGAMRRMGITKEEMTPHGFRATARTILDEVLHVRVDVIEHQLSHAVRDPNGRAYNRTSHLPERLKMMQKWADYLDGLINNDKVIAGKFRNTA
jgi:hypothetical protein